MQAIMSTLTGLSSTRKRSAGAQDLEEAAAAACKYAHAGVEPSLDEALQDPVVQLLVRADGLDPGDVLCTLLAVRERASGVRPPRPRSSSWRSAPVPAYARCAAALEAQ